MSTIVRTISWAALAGVIIPPVLHFTGHATIDTVKAWMLVFTAGWFLTAPLWMGRRDATAPSERGRRPRESSCR
jgi:hypothetical protein